MRLAGILVPAVLSVAVATAGGWDQPAAATASTAVRRPAEGPRIVLRPDRIDLVERGGRLARSIPFDGRDASLPRVAAAVAAGGHPRWLTQPRRGVFLLRAALAQSPGTNLEVAAPEVREVRLAAPGGITAHRASASFEGVRVTSWDVARHRPMADPAARRPALVYHAGSSLRIVRAELAWLGTSGPGGDTGVTWAGSSGVALDSRFHHNAAGAEVLRGARVAVSRSTFSDNAGNGLVVEGASAAPAIQRNVVRHNAGDGIVLLGVNGILLWGNLVSGNRVGVRVGRRSSSTRIETNMLDANRRGIEVYDGSRDTAMTGNVVARSAETGIVLEGATTTSRDDQVHDTPVAVQVRGLARLQATAIIGSVRGIVVGARGIAGIDEAHVVASAVALELTPGSVVRMHRSRLRAPEAIAGGVLAETAANDLGDPVAPPLPWLAVAGIAFLVTAVLLQVVHRTRNRLLAART